MNPIKYLKRNHYLVNLKRYNMMIGNKNGRSAATIQSITEMKMSYYDQAQMEAKE